MNGQERAKRIARIIEEAAQRAVASPSTQAEEPPQSGFTVTKRGGCLSCDPGYCPECGSLFTGEAFVIKHPIKGKRTLSDKAIHYLSHGIIHYQTGYVVHGEPVIVDLDLDELAGYLDL